MRKLGYADCKLWANNTAEFPHESNLQQRRDQGKVSTFCNKGVLFFAVYYTC